MFNNRKRFILRVVAIIALVTTFSTNVFSVSGASSAYGSYAFAENNEDAADNQEEYTVPQDNRVMQGTSTLQDASILQDNSSLSEDTDNIKNINAPDTSKEYPEVTNNDDITSVPDSLEDMEQADNSGEDTKDILPNSDSIQGSAKGAFHKTIVSSIQTGNDDAEVSSNSVNLTSTGLDLHGLVSGTAYTTYLRFTGIELPEDAVITNAYLEFTMRDSSSKPTNLRISGEIGTGAAFASDAATFSERVFSNAAAEMNTPILSSNTVFQTDDMKDIINEMLLNNSSSSNYVFRVEGSTEGSFVARSYNSSTSRAPRLVIEYTSNFGEFSAEITKSSDDAEEYGTGKAIDSASAMEIGGYFSSSLTPSNKQITGLRFADVDLPDDAVIEDAYMEFTTYGTTSAKNTSNMEIRIELGNPSAYRSTAGDISRRTYGALSVRYSQAAFTERYTILRTPNLKELIEENRSMGWTNGQALAFMVDGDSYLGSIYQGGSSHPARLVIKYRNDEADGGHDELIKSPEDIHNVWINEIALNGTSQSSAPWIEIFNANDYPVMLGEDIYLSDDIANPDKYAFSQLIIPANGFRVVPLSFIPSQSAPQFILSSYYNQTFHTVDTFQTIETDSNQTSGRYEDGSADIVTYHTGTYASSNNKIKPEINVKVNQPSGIYETGFSLDIQTDSVNTVRYTLDGSSPSSEYGEVYTAPIKIDESATVKIIIFNERSSSKVLTYIYQIGKGNLQFKDHVRTYQIKTGNDDAEVRDTSVDLSSTGLDLHGLISGVPYSTFLRFQDVNLPKDAVITNAYLVFTARNSSSISTDLGIYGELGDGDAFTSAASTFHNRTLTDSYASIQTPDYINVNDRVQSENLTVVLNEMRSANPDLKHYVFKVAGSQSGTFIARSYESDSSRAPQLIIEYQSGYGEYSAAVTVSSDDAEEYGTSKTISLNSSMEIGGYYSSSLTPSYKEITGFRFPNVNLPDDAEIEDAYLEFTTNGTTSQSNVSNMEVRIELGSPDTYKSTSGNISGRNYGDLSVKFQLPAFKTSKQIIRTDNLKNIIDENRLRGWKNGQSLAFLLDGDNYIGSIYQGGTANPPKLVISYKYSGKGPSIDDAVTDSSKIKNVYINEVSAEGTTSSKESYIEFYNGNDFPVVLGEGCYLSNSSKLTKYQFHNFMIPANGFRILYMDENPALGDDHADLSIKSNGELFLSTNNGSKVTAIDSLKYEKHAYNQTYGRREDGGSRIVRFSSETFCYSNQTGKENYKVTFNKERGVYETGFTLSISSKEGTAIRYTLDGSAPTEISGNIYNGPIAISKTSILKVFAYDQYGNSGVLAHTYILKDNYKNEVRSGSKWQYKDSITSEIYAKAIAELPIVSVSGNASSLVKDKYAQSTFEYLDSHLNAGSGNYFSDTGAKKFGQVSASQFNSGVAVRFKRDYNAKKAKYAFFEPFEGDRYPVAGKFGKLELKEGQDGPQNDIFDIGYNRYDEKVTNTLAKQMQKLALNSRYVHYFYNGQYMGVKTMREDYGQNLFEDYFGDDSDNYTKIRFQDGAFTSGIVEEGDGDEAILKTIMSLAKNKDLQEFKKYVDIEDMIKTQILFMFVDTEREIDTVVHNDVYNGGGAKLMFNINDTDGAFHNDNKTGTTASSFIGGGGTYRYKWLSDSKSRNGAGGMFGQFSGDSSTNPLAGNLEFKTLVKDQVLLQIGPSGGDYKGTDGAPLSVDNVKKVITDNVAELDEVYKLDAAFMSARSNMYQNWLKCQVNVQNQVTDRVKFSLEMWAKYNMAHTLTAVEITKSGSGIQLINPNAGTVDVYYTTDGTDPMGPDGIISSSARKYSGNEMLSSNLKLTIRPFTPNNWGPLTLR